MLSDEQMRAALKKVYPGTGWAKKVDRMPPAQVAAVYNRFLDKKMLKE